eukprot:scaffold136500_cov35-Tisochrysis_lutea.AAC.2
MPTNLGAMDKPDRRALKDRSVVKGGRGRMGVAVLRAVLGRAPVSWASQTQASDPSLSGAGYIDIK